MIQDTLALFAAAQSSTVSVASTDVLDTLAKGDAYGMACWFVFQVTTAATQTGTTSRATIQVQTSDLVTFTSSANIYTLTQSAAFTTAQLTVGKYWAVRMPLNCQRYIRGYLSVSGTDGGNAFTALAFNMQLQADIDSEINKRYAL